MTYDGNRLVKCDDAVSAQPTNNGAHHFTDLADEDEEYEYDGKGNMTKDLKIPSKREQGEHVRHAEREVFGMKFNREITSIEYNSLNLRLKAVKIGCTSGKKEKTPLFSLLSTRFALSLPEQITFSDDTKMNLTYDAAGNKLRAEYWTIGTFNPGGPIGPASLGGGAETQGGGIVGPILPPINQNDPQVVTDYCGNLIYRNDTLTMLLMEEGYVTFATSGTPTYHYYLKDHLGSVRIVMSQDGTVEQRNQYYPDGTLFGKQSTGGTVQPYKYGGKELERTLPLDEYDFGARWMDPVVGARFGTMDPLAEKYPWISPYAYCHGDPINRIDPDGEDDYWAFSDGRIICYNRTDTNYDKLYNASDNTIRCILVNDKQILSQMASKRTDFNGCYAVSTNGDEMAKVFLFLANGTDIEWSLVGYNTDNGKQYILNNSNDEEHNYDGVKRVSHIFPTETMFINIHSHPRKDGCDFASGQSYYRCKEGNHYDLPVSDATTMNEVYNMIKEVYGDQYPKNYYPVFFIYNARTGRKIQYDNHYRNINRGVVKRYQDLLKP